jgi:hypothetical protein
MPDGNQPAKSAEAEDEEELAEEEEARSIVLSFCSY